MWTYEHSVETSADNRAAIWRLWADVANWGSWNAEIEKVELRGPFAPGSVIIMTPPGDKPIELRIAATAEHQSFVDEARFGENVFRTNHSMEPIDVQRIRIVYRMEITGPDADALGPEMGPGITADWPETMAALVAQAERG
ncbi:hypothetical protein EDD99_0753 [Streptomyces sp. 846.5]|nr:polyketide cyclase [Streptomyces sp. 846.5]TDU02362.1 hypothetical protein EDD99_0753 [Streptomyces sp. 846.5]